MNFGNTGAGGEFNTAKENSFTTNFFNTIGVDFKIKSIKLDGKNLKLQIWDTAGQDRFRTITSSYYRGAQGIMVVYDITDRETFDNIKTWMVEIDKYAQENVIKILVANKSDLEDKRKIAYDEGQALARHYGIPFFEVSAKNANNVDLTFNSIAKIILDKTSLGPSKSEELNQIDKNLRHLQQNKNKDDSCCSGQ